MKPEKNIINKQKFFALYWGQQVAEWCGEIFVFDFDFPRSRVVESKLVLKSISQITDEDAKGLYPGCNAKEVQWQLLNGTMHDIWSDYLRTKGYLLPWMGLTPDEIISYGWSKYREDI